jgi:hypothetical protein
MATSITPAVRRGGHGGPLLVAGAYASGVAVGAALAFVVVASLAIAVEAFGGRSLWIGVAVVVVALAVARDLGVNAPVPYRNVQVPQVLRYLLPPELLAFTYGTQLGAGFLTRFTYSTHTALMVALPLVVGDPVLVVASIAAFALGKGVVLLASVGTTADEGPFGGRSAWAHRLRVLKLANAVAAATVVTTALHEGGVF